MLGRLTGVSILLVATAAYADSAADLERAEVLKSQLKYDQALAATDDALDGGDADEATLLAIHWLRGELRAGLGKTSDATSSFAHALALDPSLTLDAGASPKLIEPYAAAKAALDGERFEIRTHAATPGTLAIEVIDPTVLFASLEEKDRGPLTGPPFAIEHSSSPVTLIARDAFGNVIRTLGPLRVPEATSARSQLSEPLPWAIGSTALLATAITFGVLAKSDQSELDDMRQQAIDDPFSVSFDDFEEVRSRGKTRALVANIAAGMAVATAGTAVALWWIGRDDSSKDSPTPTVAVDPESVSVGLMLPF